MNFMNRKLFRGRAARDKLNKMGGIMASSPTLMEAVQKFKVGGGVQSTAGVRIPTNPRLADQQRASDVALGRRIKGNLLYPVGEAADLIVNRPAAGLQNLLNTLKYSAAGRFLGASEYGEQKPAPRTGTPARQSIIDYMNTGELRNTGIFRDTQTPELVSRAQASEQDDLKRRIESQSYDLSGDQQFSPQPSTLGSMEPDVQSMTNPLGRPRTPEEAATQQLSDSVIPSDMVAPGTREAEEEGMGEGVLSGFTMITGEEQPTTKSGKPKPAPAAVSTTTPLAEARTAADKARKELISMTKNPNISETEKNDAILEQFGYKSPEEDIKGLKKRAELNAQLYRDIAGIDPEEDKKIDGYNLAMMGFMIAAGDSPDALQNIAAGMAKGTSMMMDTKKARQERDRQFKMAGLDKAITDDKERKQLAIDAYNKMQDRRFSILTDELKYSRNKETVLLQLTSREKMLGAELRVKQQMAKADNISAERRTQLQGEVDILQSQISAMPEISALVLNEIGVAEALEGGYGPKFDEFINDPEKLAQAERLAQIGSKSTTKTGPLAAVPERFAQDLLTRPDWVERNQYAAIETLQAQGIENPTQNQIEVELRNRAAQQASTPITGGAAAPAADKPNTVFDTQPSDAELQQLYQQGVRQITIGNQTYPLQSQ